MIKKNLHQTHTPSKLIIFIGLKPSKSHIWTLNIVSTIKFISPNEGRMENYKEYKNETTTVTKVQKTK